MYSRIRSICIIVVVVFLALSVLLVGAYRKGWDDAVVEIRVAENETVIEMVGKKEEISAEIAKKPVPEKRKALGRYVVKEN